MGVRNAWSILPACRRALVPLSTSTSSRPGCLQPAALDGFGAHHSRTAQLCFLLSARCAVLLLLQPHIWGLDRQLDKFTTDYVQQHLQRGSHGLLTLSEMDFAFPPNVSPAMIVQGRLKGHQSVSSAGLAPVQFGAKHAASKQSKLPGGIGWLREVRHLQDPNPRLHNIPEASGAHWLTLIADSLHSPIALIWADALL